MIGSDGNFYHAGYHRVARSQGRTRDIGLENKTILFCLHWRKQNSFGLMLHATYLGIQAPSKQCKPTGEIISDLWHELERRLTVTELTLLSCLSVPSGFPWPRRSSIVNFLWMCLTYGLYHILFSLDGWMVHLKRTVGKFWREHNVEAGVFWRLNR